MPQILYILLDKCTITICTLLSIFLAWRYLKTKDKDFIYFGLSDICYILGEIWCEYFGQSSVLPVDFIFFTMFYFFIYLYYKRRTRTLLKSPVPSSSPLSNEFKIWFILIFDFIILAILSYIIYYYLDRKFCSLLYVQPLINITTVTNFVYPIFDLFLLGQYIKINTMYITNDKNAYFPLIAGISIWTIGDFLIAYEELFYAETYAIGYILQSIGLVFLCLILIILKKDRTDSRYSTIDLSDENSKIGNTNMLMNCVAIIFIAVYIYCSIIFAGSPAVIITFAESSIILLLLIILRQNMVNHNILGKLIAVSRDAVTDPLTGLYSRKYAFAMIKSLYKSSLYFNVNMSVLMLDIDYFKKYNDSHGHISGDNILKDISRLISNSIDMFNIVCRYGGEEFLIILPRVDRDTGMRTAEKIRKSIETYSFGKDVQQGEITVSIGGATASNETIDEINLVAQADAAMYSAKVERNKCVWYGKC